MSVLPKACRMKMDTIKTERNFQLTYWGLFPLGKSQSGKGMGINMKKINYVKATILALFLILVLGGCSWDNLKDDILGGFNVWLESFSKHVLTKDRDLQGDRQKGEDEYTGSYSASYDKFNGTEYLFGGTALEHAHGSQLEATYTFTVTSGSGTLYYLCGSDTYPLAAGTASDVFKITLDAGDNYLVIKGDNLCGSLNVCVERSSKF